MTRAVCIRARADSVELYTVNEINVRSVESRSLHRQHQMYLSLVDLYTTKLAESAALLTHTNTSSSEVEPSDEIFLYLLTLLSLLGSVIKFLSIDAKTEALRSPPATLRDCR